MPRSSKKSSSVAIAPVTSVPAPLVAKPSMLQTVKEGFSFGVGSSIAHTMVGRLFGSSSQIHPQAPTAPVDSCYKERRDYETCILNEDIYRCNDKQETYTLCIQKEEWNST